MLENNPWGTLSGVHPTKLARNLIEKEGIDPVFIYETLLNRYGVSEKKARLVATVIRNQKTIIRNDSLVDIYINIPICPSRCSYCSFISSEINAVRDIVPNYIECLIKEIRAVKKIISQKPYIVRSIYVGGGTPTVLETNQLEQILAELSFPMVEFTVECGRPDTITREKLQMLKSMGVTRISINPQSFTQKCLKNIGRKHTIEDVMKAYMLALEFGFKVNMDLIAGLEGETLRTFKKGIKTLLELSPDNVTIHTLALKKGSLIQESLIGEACNVDDSRNQEVSEMVEFANEILTQDGYRPYYMYRLKKQLGGLENVGYCKDGMQCIYNIDSMEETSSIIACGAHGISKRVYHETGEIKRQGNVKFIHDYIKRIDEMIANKIELFK